MSRATKEEKEESLRMAKKHIVIRRAVEQRNWEIRRAVEQRNMVIRRSLRGATCSNCIEKKTPSTDIRVLKTQADELCTTDPAQLNYQYTTDLAAQLMVKATCAVCDNTGNNSSDSSELSSSTATRSPTRAELLDQYVNEVGLEYLRKIEESIPSVAVRDDSDAEDLPKNQYEADKVDKNLRSTDLLDQGANEVGPDHLAKIEKSIPSVAVRDDSDEEDLPKNQYEADKVDKNLRSTDLLDQGANEVGPDHLAKIEKSIPSVAVPDDSDVENLPENQNEPHKVDENWCSPDLLDPCVNVVGPEHLIKIEESILSEDENLFPPDFVDQCASEFGQEFLTTIEESSPSGVDNVDESLVLPDSFDQCAEECVQKFLTKIEESSLSEVDRIFNALERELLTIIEESIPSAAVPNDSDVENLPENQNDGQTSGSK